MIDMPRPRKPYVQRETSRHGKVVWYFRRGDGPRIRLPGEYESAEWLSAYDRAYSGAPAPKPSATPHGSLRWLVEKYQESGRFARLSPETREMRKRVLDRVCETGGDRRFAGITQADVVAGRVRREATPYAAINYVKIMSQLFGFAVDAGYLTENPLPMSIDRPRPRTDTTSGPSRRSSAIRSSILSAPAPGWRWILLLYTGFRRADAVKLGRQHVKDGVIRYRTTKGKGIEVVIPLLKPLANSIAATKTGDLAFLVTEYDRPWAKESFGTWFAEQCKDAESPRPRARAAEGGSYLRCEQRSQRIPACRHVRMEEPAHGRGLHPEGQPDPSCRTGGEQSIPSPDIRCGVRPKRQKGWRGMMAIPAGFEPATIGLEGQLPLLKSLANLPPCRVRVALSPAERSRHRPAPFRRRCAERGANRRRPSRR